eukprot:12885513-Prorocentrum_lima.AAC.1
MFYTKGHVDHKWVVIYRMLGMVGMKVSRENVWVASPPCSSLSQLARRIRDDSSEVGHGIQHTRRDQNI